ncbi:MAG: WYL domain-containing protein [Acidimicrobiales bacterium]|nr:WYL domain-containing protein [Acidimicrobiales bacterium]MYB81800.1 WYL domain-containing protein [Acidimicrobiales bacterium]MYI13250.1 WYL domain-containing protein [Acidimicrobiales bacterium]
MRGPSTSAKIERLLAIVPWVVERGGATVGDIAERFEMRPAAVYDLLLAAMCYEVTGASAYENLGIVVFGGDDDAGEAWVHVEPGAMLDRPLDLSVPQAFGILVAGQSALALRGADRTGALATALDKLRAAYGERVRVSVELPLPRSLPTLREAVRAGTTVSIHYYTPNTDAVSERRVDPLDVLLADGHWYLRGWCHLRQDLRSFRVDRIEECSDTGEPHGRSAEPREAPGSSAEPGEAPGSSAEPGEAPGSPAEPGEAPGSPAELSAVAPAEADETTDVVLSIPRDDLWQVEAYPSREVRDDGDRCIVTYAIRSPFVLSQMLLRLGAAAHVVNAVELPPELAEAGSAAAASILELYAT